MRVTFKLKDAFYCCVGYTRLEDEKFLLLIGEKLRELRKKAGYSNQEYFSYDAEIPRAQYGRYEKGVNLTLLSLKKILDFHKLTFEEFFKDIA